jgi:hypothetical protein
VLVKFDSKDGALLGTKKARKPERAKKYRLTNKVYQTTVEIGRLEARHGLCRARPDHTARSGGKEVLATFYFTSDRRKQW